MGYDVSNFRTEVLERSAWIPVLVDFWAKWCGPCRILTPVLERLAEKHKGKWELKKLNTEEYPDIASQYGIQSIPNVKLFVAGDVVNEFTGALPESSIEQWLQNALPDKYQKALDQAEQMIHQQRYEDAKAKIDSVLVSSPSHERARALLAIAVLFSDRKRALELAASIEPGSPYSDIADTVRTFGNLMARLDRPSELTEGSAKLLYLSAIKNLSEGLFDDALRQFIQTIREDRYYDDDGSRKACIAIFKYLGEENDITLKHRRDFGNALYV
jgi:putative thioredoxin